MRTLTFYIMFHNPEANEAYKSPEFKIDVDESLTFPSTVAKNMIEDMLVHVIDPELEYHIYFVHST